MSLGSCLSNVELRQVICRAATLGERLKDGLIPTGKDRPTAAKRLERWQRLAANGDKAVFHRIVASDGSPGRSEKRLLGLLGDVRYTTVSAPPPWAILLREISRAVSTSFLAADRSRPLLPPKATRAIPFAHLFSPVAVLARMKVEALAPSASGWMRAEAWHGLQRHLLGRLSAICSLALQPKFLAFKAVRQPGPACAFFARARTTRRTDPTASVYRAFVHEQGVEGLRGFFLEYPVAARLAAQVTLSWIEFVVEFLCRLDEDAPAISSRFRVGEPLGKIVAVEAGLSDPHRAGHSVLLLDFAGGCRLLYKPRPLQIDGAFFDLLAAFSARLRLGVPPRPDTLSRRVYGWQSYVAHAPCPNRREARRFYRRAGALLGLIHGLRGIDFHCENLIAAGGHPIPVDLEALCHPPLPEPAFPTDADGGRSALDSSVLRTGMLPVRAQGLLRGRFPDYSALGAPVRQSSATAGVRWKYVNSARMEAFWGTTRYTCATHRPWLHSHPLSARHHVKELVQGYEQVARLLRSNDQPAMELRARITEMHRMTSRRIHRPTLLYLALIRSSLQPHLLTAGVDRSIALQALPAAPAGDAVRRAELAALERLDVPYFSSRTTSTSTASADLFPDEAETTSQVAAIRKSLRGNSCPRPGSPVARTRHRRKTNPA